MMAKPMKNRKSIVFHYLLFDNMYLLVICSEELLFYIQDLHWEITVLCVSCYRP